MHQAGTLRSYFPGSVIRRNGEKEITWIHTVTPTPLSGNYKLKLHYKKKVGVALYVLEPKLMLAPGWKVLPHVYSTPKQELCLYYPEAREWNPGLFYVHTIIPWACEWLYHYEIWAGTGAWHGGGIEHNEEADGKRKEESPD